MAKKFKYRPDHDREGLLRERFGLIKYSEVFNASFDALDFFGNLFELKSCTKNSVSSSRDTNLNHIEKWRQAYWIVGFWDEDLGDFSHIYFLDQNDMKEWIDEIEEKLLRNQMVCEKIKKCCEGVLGPEYMAQMEHILKRGSTLHDPNIKKKYVKEKGKLISTKEDLELLVRHGIPPRIGLMRFMENSI